MSRYIPGPDQILVQERIPGGGENQFSFCAICKEGHAYASLVAQRRRQYPVEFGNASTFVETTDQPVVQAAGRSFLESIGFDGIAEVEFKFDPRDGKYKTLDVNPRTWGWHTLGKAAGMDFPYLLWRQAVGLPVAPVSTHRKAAWIREITDIVAIAKSPQPMAELKRLLRVLYSRKITSATFNLLDPLPFFAEFSLWISSGISRQQKAKNFLQFDPASSNLKPRADRAEQIPGEARSAPAPEWPLADVRAANSAIVTRVRLGDLKGRQGQDRPVETSEGGMTEHGMKPRK